MEVLYILCPKSKPQPHPESFPHPTIIVHCRRPSPFTDISVHCRHPSPFTDISVHCRRPSPFTDISVHCRRPSPFTDISVHCRSPSPFTDISVHCRRPSPFTDIIVHSDVLVQLYNPVLLSIGLYSWRTWEMRLRPTPWCYMFLVATGYRLAIICCDDGGKSHFVSKLHLYRKPYAEVQDTSHYQNYLKRHFVYNSQSAPITFSQNIKVLASDTDFDG